MSLIDCFVAGGWPMYPITVIGFLFLGLSIRYAMDPGPQHTLRLFTVGLLTFLLGSMGTVLGMIHCLMNIRGVPPELRSTVVMLGLGESLNCISCALVMLSFGAIALCVGAWRGGREARAGGPPLPMV